MSHTEWRRIGGGCETTVFSSSMRENKVDKFANFGHCRTFQKSIKGNAFEENHIGVLKRERARFNISALQQYFGDYLPTTSVKNAPGGIWYIEQEKIPYDTAPANTSLTPRIHSQLEDLFLRSRIMKDSIGYDLDWFGLIGVKYMHHLINKSFWTIPNLIIDKNEHIRIIDTGILWTGEKWLDSDIQKNMWLPASLESHLHTINKFFLNLVKRRISSQSQTLTNYSHLGQERVIL